MPLYYTSTIFGCGIRKAKTLRSAQSQIKKEVGYDNVKEVRLATQEDIKWVRGMGGYVPDAKMRLFIVSQ